MSDSAQQAKAQKKAYDEACKRVLSERGIMAHILKACTEEFKDCDLQDIAQRYIENAVRRPQMAVRYGPVDHKKCTAIGLVRRGRPIGRPAGIFNHTYSCIMAGFYEQLSFLGLGCGFATKKLMI